MYLGFVKAELIVVACCPGTDTDRRRSPLDGRHLDLLTWQNDCRSPKWHVLSIWASDNGTIPL